MKVLFVIKHIEYIDPMGIMLLSSLAKEKGYQTYLNVLSEGNLLDTVKRVRPDVVAYSAKTGEHKYYLAANRAIKDHEKSIFTIMGGPHSTFHPEEIERSSFDALCKGEGFDAWPELLAALESNGDIHSIPNIVTKDNWQNRTLPELRDRKRDLDILPYYDRDLIYKQTRLGSFEMRCFMAGYGCPFPCTYCFNREYNTLYRGKGKLFNRLSVERICDELEKLKRDWPTQFIKFYDDVFAFRDDEWLEEFAEQYPRRVGLPFHCLVRADSVTHSPRMLDLLKKAGIQSISMSIESGNAYVRNEILERGMSEEDILFAFQRCHELEINTFSNTILAIPVPSVIMKEQGKTAIDYDVESIDFNIKCGVMFGEFPLLAPYPGTELERITRKMGVFDGNYDKLHMNYHNKSPFTCFTDQERKVQKNLSLLGLVCLLWPGTRLQKHIRNLVVNHLMYYPRSEGKATNWVVSSIYYTIFWMAKVYVIKTKIYPMKFAFWSAVKNLVYSFKLEYFKRSDEKFYKQETFFNRPPGEVLGGPWQS